MVLCYFEFYRTAINFIFMFLTVPDGTSSVNVYNVKLFIECKFPTI